MAVLYPPRIPSTIPAFELKADGNISIAVPFSLNRLTGITEVQGFKLKIKTVQNNTFLLDIEQDCVLNDSSGILTFNINLQSYDNYNTIKKYFNEGDYFKLQLANYADNRDNLLYSDVGIIKATGAIECKIKNFQGNGYNMANQKIIGYYRNNDSTEKLYSSRFIIYDENNNIYEDSGELLFNNVLNGVVSEDSWGGTYFSAEIEYTRLKELDKTKFYFITWQIRTTNNLEKITPKYIMAQREIPNPLNARLIAELNFDEGYIDLRLASNRVIEGINQTTSGKFIISRNSSKTPEVWDEVFVFDLYQELPDRHLWLDNTVEQGVTYTYAIQQYNDYGIVSGRILSNAVTADFEHMYLSDKDRQLKLAFNPKVSSFKPVILETKTDTIGGKYPFIYRNGHVYYHELPISGLISCQLDDFNLFTSENEFQEIQDELEKITDHSSKVIVKERLFKREVLQWLTNGEVKLLRTPTEGNFIVRLINVSMSPMEQLGRMLHTFSATAYEIEDFSFKNLVNQNLLKSADVDLDGNMQYKTINMFDYQSNESIQIDNVYGLKIEDAVPGSYIRTSPGGSYNLDGESEDTISTDIYIGLTGNYEVYLDNSFSIIIDKATFPQGLITYNYKFTESSSFDEIENISVASLSKTINKEVNDYNKINVLNELLGDIVNCQVTMIYNIDFQKKPEEKFKGVNKNDKELYSLEIYYENGEKFITNLIDSDFYQLKNINKISNILVGGGLVVNALYEYIIINRIGE